MCPTKCRSTADPDFPSPILPRARSSCDLMAAQYFNDFDVAKINDNLKIASHDEDEEQPTQFSPNGEDTEDTQDLTETVDKNVEGRRDDFSLIKDVTSDTVWHDVSEIDASLTDKEDRPMKTNCDVDMDSGQPQGSNYKFVGTNELICNVGNTPDRVADVYYRDGEITPPLPPLPPQKITLNAAPQLPTIGAPSLVSESKLFLIPVPCRRTRGRP